jgi:hypothetical protein
MRKGKEFLSALLALALACGAALPARAGGPSYTVTLRYFDDIQLTYALRYPDGHLWEGNADVPIGGTEASGQIYCIDPFVAFHAMAESTWEGWVLVDRMEGYVEAAPWAVSPAMEQRGEAVRWLVVNGYRGNYLADDAESRASVERLRQLYPQSGFPALGEAITKKIAVMATKAAIWAALAGDAFELKRTSLSPADHSVFEALLRALTDDAAVGSRGLQAGDFTAFGLELDDSAAGYTVGGPNGFYGPLTVRARLINSAGGSPRLDRVYLAAGGPDADGVVFVGGPDAPALAYGAVYGTGESAQYLEGGDFVGGEWKSDAFFLKIPADREPGRGGLVTVGAMAVAENVPLEEGTPVAYVYGADGTMDWERIQAFIGAAMEGAQMSLYAQAFLRCAVTDEDPENPDPGHEPEEPADPDPGNPDQPDPEGPRPPEPDKPCNPNAPGAPGPAVPATPVIPVIPILPSLPALRLPDIDFTPARPSPSETEIPITEADGAGKNDRPAAPELSVPPPRTGDGLLTLPLLLCILGLCLPTAAFMWKRGKDGDGDTPAEATR